MNRNLQPWLYSQKYVTGSQAFCTERKIHRFHRLHMCSVRSVSFKFYSHGGMMVAGMKSCSLFATYCKNRIFLPLLGMCWTVHTPTSEVFVQTESLKAGLSGRMVTLVRMIPTKSKGNLSVSITIFCIRLQCINVCWTLPDFFLSVSVIFEPTHLILLHDYISVVICLIKVQR